jgi:guanylate kinase
VSEKAFLKLVDESGFVEWKHHFQHYYGVTWSAISDPSIGDQIFDVDTFGKADIVRQIPDRVVSIFLLPPTLDDLRTRLTGRSDLSEDELNGRLDKAQLELERSSEYDYTVENKDLDETIRTLREIIEAEKYNRELISQDDK